MKGSQHPSHLLVLLHETRKEIAGAYVLELFSTTLEVDTKMTNDRLMI